ncbi:MAG: GTPase Era [Alphaproteobacteria bacterium]
MANIKTKCGSVAFIGAPNAGKSTLTNNIVGAKVSIVTHKVQTTRTRITGIAMVDDTQIVIIDTPGIFKPKKRLDRAMVSSAWSGAEDADVVCLLVDASHPDKKDTKIIVETLKKHEKNCVLLLNKIDTVDKQQLLDIANKFWEEGIFTDIFMISATNSSGVDTFKEWLAGAMPESEYMFDPEHISSVPNSLLAGEVTREKIFLNVHEELPYALTVETESWEDFKNGDIKINQVIYVEKENYRSILLGKGGDKIKLIGKQSREELSQMFGAKVHLFIHIKVKANWQNDIERYQGMGLDFSS